MSFIQFQEAAAEQKQHSPGRKRVRRDSAPNTAIGAHLDGKLCVTQHVNTLLPHTLL